MPTTRAEQRFPTRNYPYQNPPAGAAEADGEAVQALEPERIHAFVLGLDDMPRPLSDGEAGTLLCDPFAELLLKRKIFPLTARALLAALDAVGEHHDSLPQQRVFLVADGGQIPWSDETAGVERAFRFAIARLRDNDARLLVSCSTEVDSAAQFLQLIGWDPVNQVYNYYERRAGTWLWAGNSFHALTPPTRGRGPFDSHVNGSLVMKELRLPWNNWHSVSASINDTVLAPDDPLRDEPLFKERVSADELERMIVRPGIKRWNSARVDAAMRPDPDTLPEVRSFMRHVLQTTTVNLISSDQPSRQIADGDSLRLPTTFFLNAEALIDSVGLEPDIRPVAIPGRFYKEALERLGFALTDGIYRQPGDTFFGFLVPEPAFEDTTVLAILLQRRLLSPRFAACLLMVDFVNPVFSPARERLMAYVPEAVALVDAAAGDVRSDLAVRFVEAVTVAESSQGPQSPEAEFLANWRLGNAEWAGTFAKRIEDYFEALQQRSLTEEGVDDWMRLAESRRREFRRHPLAEFRLTIPVTNIAPDAPPLAMTKEGKAVQIPV